MTRPARSLTLILIGLIAGATAAPAESPDDGARRLAARAAGATPLMDDLRELCDDVGGRPTGSPACERAVAWAEAKFRAAGADSVAVEPFTLAESWESVRAEAACVGPTPFPIRIVAAPQSVSLAGGRPVTARLVAAGDGSPEAFARLGTTARDAVALVTTTEMRSFEDLFAEYLRNGALLESARKAGVAALLIQSTRPRGLLYRHPVALDGRIAPMPVGIVSREQAGRLASMVERGERVRVRVTLANRITKVVSKNVVADIRGAERPDEVVLLGAHLDSWDLGTGAQDNGVNCALVIDAARALEALGLRPRRTIRFVLFTGEEQGMLGSAAYVERHRAELDRHVAAVIFDIGSGKTTGFYLNGRGEIGGALDQAVAAAGLAPLTHSTEGIDGTDNFDFLLSGVPNVVANQDAAPYLPDYHAESDTFDKVDAENARANEAIALAVVWHLANVASPPATRQTRADVERLLRDTKLDEQMKAFGQWSDWTAGKRGVFARGN